MDSPDPLHRRSIAVAALSTVVEWYDFTLYLYFSTVLARVFFGPGPESLAATLGEAAAGRLGPLVFRRYRRHRAQAAALQPPVAGHATGSISMTCYGLEAGFAGGEAEGAATVPEGFPPSRPTYGEMARVTGLEPATSGVTGRRSNQLSYTRVGAGELCAGPSPVNRGAPRFRQQCGFAVRTHS
jgi:hypothetical protein